ncbi:HalOD1 output domain-containing protein [Haladaptatus sp. CMAA 1911]|uniref:HalOD1 output domain-containing protein n=1 Tax=unclassified Haladaptatus TaxID=2622732 RepID=UPI003754D563
MKYRTVRFPEEESFLPFLLLLLAGSVAHFFISPDSVLADIPEVIIPLGISTILLGFMYRASRNGYDESQLKQIIRFGWIGALGAASTGTVWVILNLSRQLPIISLNDEMMTGISIGTAGGILVGWYSLQTIQRAGSVEVFEPRHEQMVTESTWTHQPHPNPILAEIVTQIADLNDADPLSITPISEYIDPDVLAKLTEETETEWQIAFQIENYEVHVSSHGTVTVYETDYRGGRAGEVSPPSRYAMTSIDHPIRQRILSILSENSEHTRSELAERLATDSDIPTCDTHHLEIVLHHNHLPRLDDKQYIEYDPRSGDLRRWKDPEVIRAHLDE